MRKSYLFLCLFLIIGSAQAQSTIEYHLGIGVGSFQNASIRNNNNPLLSVAKTGGDKPTYSYATTGPIRLGIKSHEGKHFLLGADFSYTNVGVKTENQSGLNQSSNFAFYCLTASTQYKYIDKPNLTLYSGIDFGVCYTTGKNKTTNQKINDLTPAYQVNFLGARYGNKIGVYAECGLGFNGYVNGGVFYKMD
ncbi:MAG: hypothetical protein SGJ00_07335 [bacterium]|nr:hypothetical protein [bacterium]